MKYHGVIIALAILLIITHSITSAGVGETGMSFLKLGVAGRALSMGEAQAASATDPAALYYNPATLTLSRHPQLLFTHRESVQDFSTDFIGATTRTGDFSIGLGVNASSISDIEIRTVPGEPEGTFSARYASVGLSMAYQFSPDFSLGATGKYLYEKILIDEANGIAMDFGAWYTTPWDVRLGASVSNLGSMSELRAEATKLPAILRFGGAYMSGIQSIDGQLVVAADFVSFTGEGESHLHLGTELLFRDLIAVRAGYQTGYESRNFSTGLGLRYGLFRLDYAFAPSRNDFGSTHTISIGIEFL